MQNSVSFLALNSDGWPKYIVARLPMKPKTVVFEVERQFGTLLFSDTTGVDVFDSNDEALGAWKQKRPKLPLDFEYKRFILCWQPRDNVLRPFAVIQCQERDRIWLHFISIEDDTEYKHLLA